MMIAIPDVLTTAVLSQCRKTLENACAPGQSGAGAINLSISQSFKAMGRNLSYHAALQ